MRSHALPAGATSEPRGFDEFFVEVWPWAYRVATFLTHDPSAGEDVAQEALARLAVRWSEIDRPEAYLRRSLANAASNWHRHHRVVRERLPLVARDEAEHLVADELADAIARLPYRRRAVVVLRYYCGLTEAEIAEALGCRPGTVKSLASRAVRELAQEIER